jgi:DNA-binding MarR family transcriptional regulator
MTVSARAFFYLQQVEQLARRRVDGCLEDDVITAGQYMVLNLIVHHQPISSADLARRANMTAQSMGEFIKALESKGLVTRRSDTANRRINQITATAAGHKVLVQTDAKVDQAEHEFFDCLTREELAQLRLLLSRVRSSEFARMEEKSRRDQQATAPTVR